MSVRRVTIEKFGELSGYTPDAVRSKIKRGDWLEGAVWVKAPDGRILIDTEGYDSELEARFERASSVTKAAAGSALAVGNAMAALAPKLRDLEDFWVDLMTKRERTLRERLGAWRYLSSEWWALRKYRREGGQ